MTRVEANGPMRHDETQNGGRSDWPQFLMERCSGVDLTSSGLAFLFGAQDGHIFERFANRQIRTPFAFALKQLTNLRFVFCQTHIVLRSPHSEVAFDDNIVLEVSMSDLLLCLDQVFSGIDCPC